MSFQNFLVKVCLRLSNYKKRREKLSFEEKQAENVPNAPPRIAGEFGCETVSVEGAKGVWLAREVSGNGVLVYLHGGSYVSGPFAQQWEYLAAMCRLTKMAALLIDYRLAPQNPFPDGLDDCLMLLETLSAIGDLPEKWFLLVVAKFPASSKRGEISGLFASSSCSQPAESVSPRPTANGLSNLPARKRSSSSPKSTTNLSSNNVSISTRQDIIRAAMFCN